MDYQFYINNFDRIKNYRQDYPLAGKIFEHPQSFWFGDNPKKPKKKMTESIQRLFKRAEPQLPILVIYNIPNRDVGQYSKGGARTREKYLEFIQNFTEGVGDKEPIIIYEPDALPHSTLLDEENQTFRLELMKEALEILTNGCNGKIYIDVGHPAWLHPNDVNELLSKVTNKNVRGFSINSCNYRTTKECLKWGRKITNLRPDDYFVIDTSRNGQGPLDKEWCNPVGRGIGEPPTTNTRTQQCDAYLWIKIPGESDGKCNGGPKAGKFWGEQAEELVRNSEL